MKKLLYLVGGFFALVIGLILTILAVVFIEPTILVNEKNITWLLQQTKVLETWTWQKLEIDHEWKSWKNRRLTGDIRDLCLKYKEGSTYYACFSEISWDFDLGYEFGEGMVTKTHSPLTVISPQVELNLVKASEPREKGPPPDIYGYWSMIWNSMIPDLDMRFDSIHIQNEGKATILNFSLAKVNRSL